MQTQLSFALITALWISITGIAATGISVTAVSAQEPTADVPQTSQPSSPQQSVDAETAAHESFFVESVLPLLQNHCFECHSHAANEASGGLVLDSLASMQAGGTRGAAVKPGDLRSVVMDALRYDKTELQMPPDGKLADEAIVAIERWIQAGAHVPEAFRGVATSTTDSIAEAPQTHWAYQAPQRWSPMDGSQEQLIDQIIKQQLAAKSLSLSAAAPRETIAKRLYYDLIGLPPTLAELKTIIDDVRSDDEVLTELTDRLLASEHFGERWARYWMDIARYADNKGYVFQEDREYPGAYQYRDWLIRAFNRDMPYDEFVTWQLAADLIGNADNLSQDLPALGFLTLGRRFLNSQVDIIDDRLDVVARGLMGMTLACARCHDHKYDPIKQADYYSMSGIFMNTEEPGGEPWPHRLKDTDNSRPSFILIRGSPGNRGEEVPRRFVSFLSQEEKVYENGSGRVELAREITSTQNPLTGRVIANRIWMRMLGTSLVDSPSDLGTRCPPPLQLTLLDHLATSLMDDGWSMKRLIRRIATSKTYRQQSFHRPEAADVDPENRLYWKANRRRLDFETYRDTLLTRAGLLDTKQFGPAASITGQGMHRRTVYAYIDRQNLPSVFRTFDFASPDAHNPQRPQTSVPQQGLFVLNSGFVASLAQRLEDQVVAPDCDSSNVEAIQGGVQSLFRSVLAREPNQEELQFGVEFIRDYPANEHRTPLELWQCGYAKFDPSLNQLTDFRVLPYFEPNKWQGGTQLPDEQLGWCLLTAEGGHVGNDLEHAVVRRWIAPRDGTVVVRGKLKHSTGEGDGVRGSIIVNGQLSGQWLVHNGEEATAVDKCQVKQGDFVDFVTDCREGPSHDSFSWVVRLRYQDGDRDEFNSKRQFPEGPQQEPLGPWAQLAQCLLSTNELVFID